MSALHAELDGSANANNGCQPALDKGCECKCDSQLSI